MMPFERLAELVPSQARLASGPDELPALPRLSLATFGDDLELPDRERLRVRVAVTPAGPGIRLDFRDSDLWRPDHGFGLDPSHVHVACTLALGQALGLSGPDARLGERFTLELEPTSWVGGGRAENPARLAMGMARVFDTVLGALASAWPSRVGAGSCSLGAVVELRSGDERITEVLAGGEGAQPHRPGRHAWAGPVLAPRATAAFPGWLDITQRNRAGSGGGGARVGGDGLVRSYRVDTDVVARVGIDRRRNPPHGIDRAGPPHPSEVWVTHPGEDPIAAPSWKAIELRAGSSLTVATAGGAGHGFGGYGDIEFDASEWFGSKKSDGS